jgi:hypothetical protein
VQIKAKAERTGLVMLHLLADQMISCATLQHSTVLGRLLQERGYLRVHVEDVDKATSTGTTTTTYYAAGAHSTVEPIAPKKQACAHRDSEKIEGCCHGACKYSGEFRFG